MEGFLCVEGDGGRAVVIGLRACERAFNAFGYSILQMLQNVTIS